MPDCIAEHNYGEQSFGNTPHCPPVRFVHMFRATDSSNQSAYELKDPMKAPRICAGLVSAMYVGRLLFNVPSPMPDRRRATSNIGRFCAAASRTAPAGMKLVPDIYQLAVCSEL